MDNTITPVARVSTSPFPLIVRKIIGTPINGLQQCVIDTDNFLLTIGKVSKLIPLDKGRDAGQNISKFSIDGVEVFSSYDIFTRSTRFFITEAVAKARYQPYSTSNMASFGLSGFLKANPAPMSVATA